MAPNSQQQCGTSSVRGITGGPIPIGTHGGDQAVIELGNAHRTAGSRVLDRLIRATTPELERAAF